MELCTTKDKVRDALLLALFDLYEHGNRYGLNPDQDRTVTPEEYPALHEWLAECTANGWLEFHKKFRGVYVLTAAGYKEFLPRATALRILGSQSGQALRR